MIEKYGVGEQSFEALISEGYVYVDKSLFIEKLLDQGKYFFLARPRRFGKSLFLSTLKCYFEGKKKLFKDLYIYPKTDWNKITSPVLHLDLNPESYSDERSLHQILDKYFSDWENTYGLRSDSDNPAIRFSNIIKGASQKTGKKVVILVDEYDKPLVNNLSSENRFSKFRDLLSSIYSAFKSNGDYIKLVFLTGVSRLGKLNVFSGLNNLRDISFDIDFNSLCGLTEKELLTNFPEGLIALRESLNMGQEDLLSKLKEHYDGYRFSIKEERLYNPFSILNVLVNKDFRDYWVESGQATLLLEQLKRFKTDLENIFPTQCNISELPVLDLENSNPVPLLYQTGYLTIKNFDPISRLVTLDLPNYEVKNGFFLFLLPYYANLQGLSPSLVIYNFLDDLKHGKVDSFIHRLENLFASVPYDMAMEKEQNIHNALLIFTMLIGLEVRSEFKTSKGRIDLLIDTDIYIYIIELKLDGTAEEALTQIETKEYDLQFRNSGKEIIKIGISFSSQKRNIDDYKVLTTRQ